MAKHRRSPQVDQESAPLPQLRIQQEFVDWILARDVRNTADGVCQCSFMKKGRESLHSNILSIDLWHRLGGSRRWGLVKKKQVLYES